MFSKLMKYELRYLIRIFAPMWAAVVFLAVAARVTMGPHISNGTMMAEGTEAVLPAIMMMLAMFSLMTMMFVAMIVLIQRFYKGMYGDEGYLMFTLPVTSGQLIHSKGLSAMLMLLVSELVMLLGIFIMVMTYPELLEQLQTEGMTMSELFELFMEFMGESGVEALDLVMIGFWAVVSFLLSTASNIYMLYLAISLGQLWKKHPVAGAVAAYYVITIALSAVEMAVAGFIGGDVGDIMLNWIPENMAMEKAMLAMLVYSAVHSVIVLLGSFLGTKLMLDRNLNIA